METHINSIWTLHPFRPRHDDIAPYCDLNRTIFQPPRFLCADYAHTFHYLHSLPTPSPPTSLIPSLLRLFKNRLPFRIDLGFRFRSRMYGFVYAPVLAVPVLVYISPNYCRVQKWKFCRSKLFLNATNDLARTGERTLLRVRRRIRVTVISPVNVSTTIFFPRPVRFINGVFF